ncbi:HAD hydrolase-like protein [Candidatus Wolfebacteria bacterium]|nr:HAD hydrolase-like protein [Candidatus Wolfebacteria bacterium]
MTAAYPAILFDLDGTLVLSLETKINNAAHLWSEKYTVSPEMVRTAYKSHSGLPRRQLFQLIGQETIGRSLSDEEFGELSEEFTRCNIETLRLQPFVIGCEALLLDLSMVGVKMGISSSADPIEVEMCLRNRRGSSLR